MSSTSVYFPDPKKEIHKQMKVASACEEKSIGEWVADTLRKASADSIRKFAESETKSDEMSEGAQ